MLQSPPLSLYVHMPWCVRKCPYCDFNSHAAPELVPQAEYIDALLADLELDLPLAADRPVLSIFFGGGTPSLFAPEQIDRLLRGVRQRIALASDAEITLEANPGTIEHGRFAGYRDAGINRVSLGAQSFDPTHLQRLGRIHGRDDIQRAVEELRSAGIANFNLDLMYALPQQTLEQAVGDVDAALALAPTHLSHYQLTLEPGTVFYHRPPPLPDADLAWQMQEACHARLALHGYAQYEISAFAQGQQRCRHNLNYWEFGDYIGIGAGAHGKLTDVERGCVLRTERPKQPLTFLRGAGKADRVQQRIVSRDELAFEFLLNVLRLPTGFSETMFEGRTGRPIEELRARLEDAARRKLLESMETGVWRPTELGLRFLNDLQGLFLPERSPNHAG